MNDEEKMTRKSTTNAITAIATTTRATWKYNIFDEIMDIVLLIENKCFCNNSNKPSFSFAYNYIGVQK
jgi:hypothetical protein